jgi:hypothetical protein
VRGGAQESLLDELFANWTETSGVKRLEGRRRHGNRGGLERSSALTGLPKAQSAKQA